MTDRRNRTINSEDAYSAHQSVILGLTSLLGVGEGRRLQGKRGRKQSRRQEKRGETTPPRSTPGNTKGAQETPPRSRVYRRLRSCIFGSTVYRPGGITGNSLEEKSHGSSTYSPIRAAGLGTGVRHTVAEVYGVYAFCLSKFRKRIGCYKLEKKTQYYLRYLPN